NKFPGVDWRHDRGYAALRIGRSAAGNCGHRQRWANRKSDLRSRESGRSKKADRGDARFRLNLRRTGKEQSAGHGVQETRPGLVSSQLTALTWRGPRRERGRKRQLQMDLWRAPDRESD